MRSFYITCTMHQKLQHFHPDAHTEGIKIALHFLRTGKLKMAAISSFLKLCQNCKYIKLEFHMEQFGENQRTIFITEIVNFKDFLNSKWPPFFCFRFSVKSVDTLQEQNIIRNTRVKTKL